MKDILKLAYNQICSKVIIRESFLIGSQQIIKWIPILLCWSPDKYIGISEIGEWVVEEESGLRILSGPSSLVRVKILLEQPIETIRKQLGIYSDNIDIEYAFPFLDIIQGVLEDGFEYWMELAFIWYDKLPLEKKFALKPTLHKIVEENLSSQKLRHKARKELKKLPTQSDGYCENKI